MSATAGATIDALSTELDTFGREKIPQRLVVKVSIEVTIEYPADMPPDTALAYAATPAEWIRKYAESQAKRESAGHKD